jgi:hypothetical protein
MGGGWRVPMVSGMVVVVVLIAGGTRAVEGDGLGGWMDGEVEVVLGVVVVVVVVLVRWDLGGCLCV